MMHHYVCVTIARILMLSLLSKKGGAAYAQGKIKAREHTMDRFILTLIAFLLVYALYNMAYSMGMFLGPVYAGAVMAVAGFKTLMFTFAIALVICSPVMMDWKAVWRRVTACVRSH